MVLSWVLCCSCPVRWPCRADGTQETIKKALAGVPGKLLSDKFVDFATTRNLALRVCLHHSFLSQPKSSRS